MLLECVLLQETRDEYYIADLHTLFKTIPETCKIEFLHEAEFFWYEWLDIL